MSASIRNPQVRGLEWDPFCPNYLATGGTDGMVKLWSIPADGLQEDLTTPIVSMSNICERPPVENRTLRASPSY